MTLLPPPNLSVRIIHVLTVIQFWFLFFRLQGSLAKDIFRINSNISGAKNTPIKTYSLHNIIFNEYIIVIIHMLLKNNINKWIVSIQSCFSCLWFCEYPSARYTKNPPSSLVLILKMSVINSCEANPLALSDWMMTFFTAGLRSWTVSMTN